MKSRVILFVMTILMLVGASVQAWQPEGWVYHAGDYAYSIKDGEWYYFNSTDTQWRVNLDSKVWDKLTDATGWNYHAWPYSYSIDTHAWSWFNTNDEQWCIGLTSGQWTEFGEDKVVDKVSIGGTVWTDDTKTEPVAGAVVGTSLDGQTTITDTNGNFFLQTDTSGDYSSKPYTITIKIGSNTTSLGPHSWGDHPVNQDFWP